MRNNFDRIAPFYDLGVELVFGTTVSNASFYFLNRIKPSDHVLIVGGGTGDILKHLPVESKIDYVELSKRMIQRSKKKAAGNVTFHLESAWDFGTERKFDWIILPFFFDLFRQDELSNLINKLKGFLAIDGKILVSDFAPPTLVHQQVILKLTILVLRFLVGLGIRELSPIRVILASCGLHEQELKIWKHGFIFSGIYQ